MSAPLRVAIVEYDIRLRIDFAKLVSRHGDMMCVGAFESGEEALRGLPHVNACVLLVDVDLPGISGIDLVRHLRAAKTPPKILMLTTFDDTASVFASLEAGADGYVRKRAALGELSEAIREVVARGALGHS